MTTSALQNPLDRLAEQIHEVIDLRTPEQRLAFDEVLGMIEALKREQAEIARQMENDPPGRTYSK